MSGEGGVNMYAEAKAAEGSDNKQIERTLAEMRDIETLSELFKPAGRHPVAAAIELP
jgi:hypothetical protein